MRCLVSPSQKVFYTSDLSLSHMQIYVHIVSLLWCKDFYVSQYRMKQMKNKQGKPCIQPINQEILHYSENLEDKLFGSVLTHEPYYLHTDHSVQSWHSASAPGRPELDSPYSYTCWCSLTGPGPLTCETHQGKPSSSSKSVIINCLLISTSVFKQHRRRVGLYKTSEMSFNGI